MVKKSSVSDMYYIGLFKNQYASAISRCILWLCQKINEPSCCIFVHGKLGRGTKLISMEIILLNIYTLGK